MPVPAVPTGRVTTTTAELPELVSGLTAQTVITPDGTPGIAFARPGDAYPCVVLVVAGASSGLYVGDGKSLPVVVAGQGVGGLPSWFQYGVVSPVGVVTPSQRGALYQNIAVGALYVALNVTSASWAAIGGLNGGDAPGVAVSLSGNTTVWAKDSETVALSDLGAAAGHNNGAYWNYNGDPDGSQVFVVQVGSTGQFAFFCNADGTLTLPALAATATQAPRLSQLSPKFTITSGALPTQQLVTATAAQVSTTCDVEVHTPVTFTPGVATTALCKVELSPDGTTFSELCTYTYPVGVAFDGSILDVVVRVPAAWRIKLTVTNATLGLSTYY